MISAQRLTGQLREQVTGGTALGTRPINKVEHSLRKIWRHCRELFLSQRCIGVQIKSQQLVIVQFHLQMAQVAT